MEVLFALPLLFLPFFLPFVAGLMAKNFGRSFWTWFWLSMPFPVITHILLLCLPDKSKTVAVCPVENEEMFDHLFQNNLNEKTHLLN